MNAAPYPVDEDRPPTHKPASVPIGQTAKSDLGQVTASDPVRHVLTGVRDLAHSIDRYRQSLGTRHGIGVPEVVTLTHLAATERVRAGDIAERTGLTQASVTALLDRLERRDYIRRVRPPDNRRTVLVELTGSGRDLALGMYAPVVPLLAAAAAEPGAPDPERMAHCLQRIASMLIHLADNPGDS